MGMYVLDMNVLLDITTLSYIGTGKLCQHKCLSKDVQALACSSACKQTWEVFGLATWHAVCSMAISANHCHKKEEHNMINVG